MTNYAPIALFVYKRFEHTLKTVEALQKNLLAENSDLIIFSDGAKKEVDVPKIQKLREYLNTIEGFKSVKIIKREKNFGLAASIIDGVTTIINQYKKIIVLEDDLVTSPYFLKYMNAALTFYENQPKVAAIHGYVYPVKENLSDTFFLRGADCWGWATWERAWKLFNPNPLGLLNKLKSQKLLYEFDINGTTHNVKMLKNQAKGKVDSWAIRWHASVFIQNMLTLYPGKSLVQNIGTDGEGTHTNATDVYKVFLADNEIEIKEIPVTQDEKALRAFEHFFISIKPNFVSRFFKKLLYKK
ncbi:MAG TPA: glycosyl transferase [Bacteroidetes bacterium]|nr:glycosyl transferase [Bacteroidota bacterium]HRI45459.1 glycosyltransferase [Ignavibacteriaceae bacterium]